MTRSPRSVGLRSCLAALLVAFLAVNVLAMAPGRAEAAEPGVNNDLTWFPPEADRVRTAAAMQDIGSRWTRIDIGWADFEPSKGVYSQWHVDNYRAELQRARAAGQKIIVMVATSPQWASGSTVANTPPRDPADYARFLSYLGQQYGSYVDAWEIWNEPNLQRFWSTGPNPAAYAALVKAAYPAVKAADPGAPVVMGATSTNDYRFIEGAYAAGVKGYFDVLSTHPYSCDAPETIRRDANGRLDQYTFAGYRELRAVMAAQGDAKPIFFTEFGWSTSTQGCGVSESVQADWLTRAYRFVEQDRYVEVALTYTLRNHFSMNDADNVEARYGLMRTDFTPKPSYSAFKAYAASTAPNAAPTVALTSPSAGSTFNRSLAIAANASDDQAVTRVQFLVDATVIGTDYSVPYALTWSVPKKFAYGAHTITARAYDAEGLSGTDSVGVVRATATTTLSVSTVTLSSPRTSVRANGSRALWARGTARSHGGRVTVRLLKVRNGHRQVLRTVRVAIRKGHFATSLGPVSRGGWVIEARVPGAASVRQSVRA